MPNSGQDALQPTGNTSIEFQVVLSAFNPQQQDVICSLSHGQNEYRKQIASLKEDRDYDIIEGQSPEFGVSGCSDTRVSAHTMFNIKRVGRILTLESPGGAMCWGNKLTQHSIMFLDLLAKYGVPTILIGQHHGCGGMGINGAYHGNKDPYHGDKTFKAHIRRNFEGFTTFCDKQRVRYQEVKELGLDHFEEKGIPLVGTEDQKLQQALAIQQAVVDHAAVTAYAERAKKRGSDYTYPNAIASYLHLPLGRIFVYESNDKVWTPVPLIKEVQGATSSPALPTLKMHCCDGCGCGLGGNK